MLRQRIFSSFSVPDVIVSDNASCFVSREFSKFCFKWGIRHVTTTPYYPQPSHAERFNRNLKAALIAYHADAQDRWDQDLDWLQLAFNTATHESTNSTPFQTLFPFRPGSPLVNRWGIQELLPNKVSARALRSKWLAVRKQLQATNEKVARKYNVGRVPCKFKIGDAVWLKAHHVSKSSHGFSSKLAFRWKGPFVIDKFLTPVTVRLVHHAEPAQVFRAHLSQIKPAHM
jgi:hypothetical protein